MALELCAVSFAEILSDGPQMIKGRQYNGGLVGKSDESIRDLV